MTKQKPKSIPCAYFITCRTYGTWLHGDERQSVDRKHNTFLSPKIKQNSGFYREMQGLCKEEAFVLNPEERKTVLQSIIDTCHHAQWHLYAAHVRTNHMHVIVKSEKAPEKIAISLKAFATRYLKEKHLGLKRNKFWSQGASTRYIYQSDFLFRAIQYTIEEQGKEMAFYCDPGYYDVLKSL